MDAGQNLQEYHDSPEYILHKDRDDANHPTGANHPSDAIPVDDANVDAGR
jgi:hypothetical protein